MTSTLLFEVANLFRLEADAIQQPNPWPPRQPLTDEERREVLRLDVMARRIAYRAAVAAYEEAEPACPSDGACDARCRRCSL